MTRDHSAQWIERTGLIAIVRLERSSELVKVAKAIAAGGVSVIEFTLTTPGALRTIEESTRELGDQVLIGAETQDSSDSVGRIGA